MGAVRCMGRWCICAKGHAVYVYVCCVHECAFTNTYGHAKMKELWVIYTRLYGILTLNRAMHDVTNASVVYV
jgi:hypothetical protein